MISRWLDGSFVFNIILWLFNAFINVCRGSFIVEFFSAGFEHTRLKRSLFVRLAESGLNAVPKLFANVQAVDSPALPLWIKSSGLISTFLGSFGFEIPAWILLLALVAVPFLPTMVLAGMLVLVFILSLFWYRFDFDLTSVAILFFMAVSLFVGGVTSLSPGSSLSIALLIVVITLSYILVRVCFKGKLDFALAAFIISAGLTVFVAFYQILVGYEVDEAWLDPTLRSEIGIRIGSTFGNPNVYGTFLLLMIPLSFALIFYAKKPFYKLCAAGITGLLLLALGLTFSRGSYMAVAVALALFVLILEKRLIVFFVGGVFALPFILPPAVITRVFSIFDFSDSSTLYRMSIWRGALRLLGDFWMIGLGQGADAYNRAAPLHALSGVFAAHSHNLFLQIFLETGIVGFIAFMAIIIFFFHGQFSFMKHTTDPRRRILSAAFISAAVGFLIQGMFDYPFHNYSVMLTFFIFLGLGSLVAEQKT